MVSRHSNGSHGFIGDWPADDELEAPHPGQCTCPPCHRRERRRHDGVGPLYTDEKCESCGVLIQATGECRCSL